MNIRFHSIKLHNFMSFSDAEVSLSDRGYVLVRGENNNPTDNAKSNGARKTTIFHALSWCLTGQTLSGIRSNVTNIYLEDGCFVELYFSSDGHEYRLLRAKDSKEYKTDLKLFIDDKDKSGKGIRESEKLLEQYLPELNYQLLGSVILLGQGLPQRFTNNTPSGRKEVLEKLSKSDFMIEDLKNKLTKRKGVLQEDLRKLEDAILTDTTTLKVKEQYKQTTQECLSALDPTLLEEQRDSCEQQIVELKAQHEQNNTRLEYLHNALFKLQQEKDLLFDSYNKSLCECQNTYEKLLSPVNEQIQQQTIQARSLQTELTKLNSIKDVCPTCGQHIPGVHKPDTSGLEMSLQQAEIELASLAAKQKELAQESNKQKQQLEAEYNQTLHQINTQQNELTQEKQQTESKLSFLNAEITNKISTLSQVTTQLNSLQITAKNYRELINSLAEEITELNTQILYNNVKKEEITTRISYVTKMITLATRDFRGVLLSNIIAYVDTCAKTYCQHIFETDRLNFYLDGNNIDISYDGKLYESLSTGEKQKVDIIVQPSLRDMLCKYMNFNCNILALDEVFDGLDSLGCERIVSLINNITDIESIFIITHHATDIELSYDDEIVVVKNKHGISEIR